MDSPSPQHQRHDCNNDGDYNSVTTSSDQEQHLDYLDQQASKYLDGISASFNHTDFENNVRHVIRIRRHALKQSGPSKEDYYQSLVENYKRQQQQESEKANLEKLRNDDSNSNNSENEQERLRNRLKLIGKNNTQAAEARKRIKDSFGEDYGAAGRALLHGARLPETTQFDDCTTNVTAAGSRATLWARTLKQWRRDKASGLITSEDTRATQAMASVAAKFEQEEMKSKLTGEEVQQWADHLIKEKLCDRTKGIVGRIQSVIKHSRKSERQRIRRDFFKQNRNAEGADEVLLKRETEQRKMQEELFRILSQGGDFTKNMSPELHGLWLRSLLPGQQIGGIGDDDDDDDFDEEDKDEEDENAQGKMAPETDFEVMNRVERAKFSEKLVDELPQQQNQNNNNGGNGASSPTSPAFSTIRVTRHNSNSNKNSKKTRISDLLARANVDPKMLEVDSIRERAKKVLFGGISCLVIPRSPSSSSCEKNDSSNDHNEENDLSRAASSISVFSSTSTKNNNNVNSSKNDSSKHQQHQQHNTTSMSGETFGMNTPAVSEVIGHEDDLHGNRAFYSPSKTASTMNVNNESNNNQQLENSRENNNTSGSLLFNLSKNPNISDALLAGAARRKMEREQAKNVNSYNTRNNDATIPPPSPSASETSARSTSSDDPDGNHRLKKEHYAMSKHTPDFVFGGANLSQVATAKEAREKVMRLLEAEIHDDDNHESENNIENGNRNNDPLSSKFERLKEAAANAKYLKATKHWGDSRHALVWDFEMDQIRDSVAREVGRDPSKWRSSPNRNRNNKNNNNNNNLRQNSTGSSAASSSLYHSPKSIESGSTSLSRSDDCCHRQNITASSNVAIDGPVKKSERLQKLERTIHLLETRQIGNFVAKDKFFCRLERNNYAALNNNNNNVSDESHPRLPGGENSAVGMDRAASAVNFGQSDKKFRSMHFGGSIIGGGMEDEASFRSNARFAPAADVLASSPKQHNLLLHKQHQQQYQQQDIHSNNMNMNQNQKPKLVAIPELDHAFGKYHCALDIKLSHLDPATEKPFALRLTNMPEPDLYAYQRYAKEKNMVIIIRPISEVVPQLYATPGLHIKGKSINVSLKSSSYCPIDGLIPVNPALGKAYLDAMRREREIEDMILNATGGVVTVSLLKRLRAQKAAAGSLTQAFRRDIITALERSELELNQIMEEYREKLVVTVDKETISRAYIERFNEAQFLGTTHAQWKGQGIFYREIPGVGVERDPREAPVFYIETHPGVFIHYVPETDSLDDVVATQTEELLPVMVVTHRMFTVSETTKRIEPDPTLFMIGPDFDGLVYARRVELSAAAQERIDWSLKINHYRLNRTMGLVNEFDIEHVKEVRLLTEWKQNHGYECGNTVKTQPITVAAHAVITPDSFTILTNIFEIVSYIRTAWKHNIPLIVNPNWRAVLDGDLMPRLYGEDLSLPVVDDCGASAAQTRFEVESVVAGGHSYDYVKKVVGGMTARAAQMRKDFRDNRSRGGASSGGGGGAKLGGTSASSPSSTAHQTQSSGTDEGEATLEEAVKLVVDKKEMSELFYEVRRWQLMPPVFVERNGAAATTQSKLYGNGDERTRWDAPFDDPVVNQEYEKFRKSQVEAFLVEYQKGKQDFLQMHGERSSRAFIDTLDDYLFPEPYPKTI